MAGPGDCVLALLDPLLCHAAIFVERHHTAAEMLLARYRREPVTVTVASWSAPRGCHRSHLEASVPVPIRVIRAPQTQAAADAHRGRSGPLRWKPASR